MKNWLKNVNNFFQRWLSKLLDKLPGSTEGSKLRNLVSYYALFLISPILVALFYIKTSISTLVLSFAFFFFAFVFYIVVIGVIFLISNDFKLNPVRFIRDILISMAYTIASFAYLFKHLGIADSAACQLTEYSGTSATYIYFSAVTFSTLGFGDFRPMPEAQLVAMLEALIGNLHLGLIAGAVFYLINSNSSR